MPYRVEFPPDIKKNSTTPSGLSLPKITGDTGDNGDGPDITEGWVIAYLIASEILGADIWFALDDSFNPGDGLAVFYPDELPFLATKDAEQFREIHKGKLAFPGARVIQDGGLA